MTITIRAGLLGLAALVPAGAGRAEPVPDDDKVFRAGAVAVDVSPARLPVLVNGGFLQQKADPVNDRLHARCLVLDDGATRVAIVVVDSCMMPRDLIDRAKDLARDKTGIPGKVSTIEYDMSRR